MEAQFVQDRITQLRLQKGVLEYKMSYDLGHSRGYINNISSGKTLPSMAEFFAICDYFEITPIAFFDPGIPNPGLLRETTDLLSQLEEDDLRLTRQNIARLLKNNPHRCFYTKAVGALSISVSKYCPGTRKRKSDPPGQCPAHRRC